MTNQTIRIPIGQSVSGVVNTDTGVTSINLRASTGGGALYNGTHVGDGVYEFTGVASGSYKVFSSSTELTKISWVLVGESGAVLITSDQTIAGVKTFSAQAIFSSGLATNTISERTAGAGVTIDGVLIKDDLNTSGIMALTGTQDVAGLKTFTTNRPEFDSSIPPTTDDQLVDKLYVDTADALALHKAGAETITGAKLWKAASVIDTVNGGTLQQSVYLAPPSNLHFTPKKYVDDIIASYLSGLTVPLSQQSSRTIRVIYDGVFEGGSNPRVELTINNAIASASAGTPVAGKQYYIFVEKNGGETGIGSAGNISSLVDYVHISGQNINTVINGDDTVYTAGALGRVVVKDCALTWTNGATATPSFTNVIFENVLFDINDNSIDFTTCMFLNCRVKGTAGNWTITNCSGTPILADELPSTITGYAPEIIITGLYHQRKLGTLPSIASAGTLTLTYGNSFNITGTTTIANITNTGWTDGSQITLYFEQALTLTNNAVGVGHFALSGGTDFNVTAGSLITLMLRSTLWYEVSRTVN